MLTDHFTTTFYSQGTTKKSVCALNNTPGYIIPSIRNYSSLSEDPAGTYPYPAEALYFAFRPIISYNMTDGTIQFGSFKEQTVWVTDDHTCIKIQIGKI